MKVPSFSFLSIILLPREEGYYAVKVKAFGFLGFGIIPQMKELVSSLETRVVEIEGKNHLYWYWRGVSIATLGILMGRLIVVAGLCFLPLLKYFY